MVQLGEHFARKDQGSHADALRQQRWFIKSRQDTARREKAQDRVEDDIVALAADVIMATQAQVAAFEANLDTYDEATVTALMENQILLDAVNARIEAMLEQAYVMEDGRRVFRTEDGTQVFDEHGLEVSALELDPQMIGSGTPTWEAYSAVLEARAGLTAERSEILDYQEQLDAAREQIADGEISEADLEALDADLLDAMPESVRTHVPGMEMSEPAPDARPQLQAPAATQSPQMQNAEASAPAPMPFQ